MDCGRREGHRLGRARTSVHATVAAGPLPVGEHLTRLSSFPSSWPSWFSETCYLGESILPSLTGSSPSGQSSGCTSEAGLSSTLYKYSFPVLV